MKYKFFTFKILRKGFSSSWISLKFVFLWNSTNFPRKAYQSIQERELYLLKPRLIGVRIRTELVQGNNWESGSILAKTQKYTYKLNESWINEVYDTFKELYIVQYFTSKNYSKNIKKKLYSRHSGFFLFISLWAKFFCFSSVFSEKLPDKVGKIGISMWSADLE